MYVVTKRTARIDCIEVKTVGCMESMHDVEDYWSSLAASIDDPDYLWTWNPRDARRRREFSSKPLVRLL